MTVDVKLAANGRMVLPQAVRQAMGVTGETRIVLTVEDGEVRLSPASHGIARAQQIDREHAKGNISVDDFLRERKAEAKRDNEKY